MKKILFLIHDLGQGGAEKVLVNLVNNLDKKKFDVTVISIFDIGENKQFLDSSIHYKYCFKHMVRGNSHLMKLLSPKQLHKWLITDKYDIEVAYLEGPCARIISGCPNFNTKLVSWIHIQQKDAMQAAASFRNIKEATDCYNRFNKIICVSNEVKETFTQALNITAETDVLYNTNNTNEIYRKSKEEVNDLFIDSQCINIIGIGKLLINKGFDRVVNIISRLVKDGLHVHLYILGSGPEENNLKEQINKLKLEKHVTLLGYQLNPYKYLNKMDLFVCASYAEGFSTAATEALILGIPVCTVKVSGMKEMLGNDEYGIITENNDDALYEGLYKLVSNPELLGHYRVKASERGKDFKTEETVLKVEEMLLKL